MLDFTNLLNLKQITKQDKSGKSYIHKFNKYDLDGNLLEETYANSRKRIFNLDKKARILKIESSSFNQIVKSYDKIGRIKGIFTQAQHYSNNADFEYDDLNQLKTESGIFENTFSYDSHFNGSSIIF